LENTTNYPPPLAVSLIAHQNTVRERRVTQDGQPDLVWTYGGNPNGIATVTSPDGNTTTYFFNPSGPYLDSSVAGMWTVGPLVYRIEEQNGTIRKRLWSQNRTSGSGPQIPVRNAWVKRETVSVRNSAGDPTLTAVTDHLIDRNGNNLQTIEYDWVPYNAVGVETGATVKRTTQTTYYASVPQYNSFTEDPKSYWNMRSIKQH